MLDQYRQHAEQRAALGIPPLPLDQNQTAALLSLLADPPCGEEAYLMHLLEERIPAGVDEAARLKAEFLCAIANGAVDSPLIDRPTAVGILGSMRGGYNVAPLVALLEDDALGPRAALELSQTLLVLDAFDSVASKAAAGNCNAAEVLRSWAAAAWFTSRPKIAEAITVTVFKVPGETNTDNLSPAVDAWSRSDIPLHALTMLKHTDIADVPRQVADLKAKGHAIAFAGDIVGTGSSRKSAVNSLLWHTGNDIANVPNKRSGGICLGAKIAPIFFATLQDSGALAIECDVSKLNMGDIITIYPHKGRIEAQTGELICRFSLRSERMLDEAQAGGRIALIIGRALTAKARETLGLPPSSTAFRKPSAAPEVGSGYTLAQKIVGRACGIEGVRPGTYCEPHISTVGSQDTTGPMTRAELSDLSCLEFSADLVMQSFCHTAAYPKPVDINTQHTLPGFFTRRGGVSLRPGDGIIHSWLNRMLLPDQVGTGADSHTRFPLGISFPAGSGLVAFAAALGVMPLQMPESVLVRFKGERQPGITLRDLVNAIPYWALKTGDLTLDGADKKNVFNGRIIEIEGLPDLKVEQAFELSDATVERSAAGCTIHLDRAPVIEYLSSNVALLRWMIGEGYGDARTLARRAEAMEQWLENPTLLGPDDDAEYAKVLEIDLREITEPLLACPNDPDDVRPLSEVADTPVDEVFIGSCMTNIGHFRAAGRLLGMHGDPASARLWIAPPTKMDEQQLVEEGYYAQFAAAGARTEMPGCSLCMGNQARVAPGTTVVSTSTRNFPNRMGKDANVYLSSAELAAVTALLGRIPSVDEYMRQAAALAPLAPETFRYLNFDQLERFVAAAPRALIPVAQSA